jgi:hypothetical protein
MKAIAYAALLLCSMACLAQMGCDDYNIVEPRFYGKDDVQKLPICEPEDIEPETAPAKVIPVSFGGGICWLESPEIGDAIVVQFNLPMSTEVDIGLFNSAGLLVKQIAHGALEAGTHTAKIGNAASLKSGVYAISMTAGDFSDVIWFEID